MKYCTGDVWVVELSWSERNETANRLYGGCGSNNHWQQFPGRSPCLDDTSKGVDRRFAFVCVDLKYLSIMDCLRKLFARGSEMPITYVELLEERSTSQRK